MTDPSRARYGAAVQALSQGVSVFRQVWNHPANRGRRVRQVARAIQFQLRGRVLRRRTLTPLGERSMIWAELHRTASSKVLYGNPPDWAQMMAWRRRLGPGTVFVDVGANVGAYTIFAAELGAYVIAVEPSSTVSDRLRENLALNGYDAELHEVVLSNEPGTVLFDDSLDVLGHVSSAGVEKRAETLDRLLGSRHAAGVKIDVEGAERLVLEGAVRALCEHRIACLQIEWNKCSADLLGESRAPIAQLLTDYGYTLYRPDDNGELTPADVSAFGPDVFALAHPP